MFGPSGDAGTDGFVAVRVAFDAGPSLGRTTGVGRYTGELADALEPRGIDLVRYAVSWRAPRDDEVARWKVPARVAQVVWRRWERPRIERLVGDVDVVHATNFVLPPTERAAGVVTVHDLSFMRDDAFPGRERLRDLVPWSVRRARGVLVPTAAVAAEVAERYGVDTDRIVITHEGVSPLFFGATPLSDGALAALGIGRPFAIAVGTIEPRKNLARLLRAWSAAGEALRDWTLVIAGPRGWGPSLPRAERVLPIGYVRDETLPGLLAAAGFFCYPSVYEGFGLPPLEAMAAGTAALVGHYPAADEVVGDAGLLIDPLDVDALASGLARLATDDALRRQLAIRGRARATGFTWEKTAVATVKGYERALDP